MQIIFPKKKRHAWFAGLNCLRCAHTSLGGYICPSLAEGEEGLLSVIQNVLRGGYKRPSLAEGEEGVLICSLMNASVQRSQIKTPFQLRWKGVCAQDWIRTSTPFPALPPQGSASTNFATWARGRTKLCKNQDMKKWSGDF